MPPCLGPAFIPEYFPTQFCGDCRRCRLSTRYRLPCFSRLSSYVRFLVSRLSVCLQPPPLACGGGCRQLSVRCGLCIPEVADHCSSGFTSRRYTFCSLVVVCDQCGQKSLVIYPLLGFLATLAWGLDVRLSV